MAGLANASLLYSLFCLSEDFGNPRTCFQCRSMTFAYRYRKDSWEVAPLSTYRETSPLGGKGFQTKRWDFWRGLSPGTSSSGSSALIGTKPCKSEQSPAICYLIILLSIWMFFKVWWSQKFLLVINGQRELVWMVQFCKEENDDWGIESVRVSSVGKSLSQSLIWQ